MKLEELGLDETPIPVVGNFTNSDPSERPPSFNVDWDAFRTDKSGQHWDTYSVSGSLLNFNTVEGLKKCDKQRLLLEEGGRVVDRIKNGQVLKDPSTLNRFVLLLHADLKKYLFRYWFAFPALPLSSGNVRYGEQPQRLQKVYSQQRLTCFAGQYATWKTEKPEHSGFFCLVVKGDDDVEIVTLEAGLEKENGAVLCFSDPGHVEEHPGWPLRNLLCVVALRHPRKLETGVEIVGVRQRMREGKVDLSSSIHFSLKGDDVCVKGESEGCIFSPVLAHPFQISFEESLVVRANLCDNAVTLAKPLLFSQSL